METINQNTSLEKKTRLVDRELTLDTDSLRDILELTNDAIVVHNSGVPLYYNNNFLVLLGYDDVVEFKEALGEEGLYSFVHKDDISRVLSSHEERMSGVNAETKYYSVRLRHKDQHYLWIDTKISSLYVNGKHLVMICMQNSNEMINQYNSNTHYQTLFDHILTSVPAAITITSVSDGIYHHVSDLWVAIMGYDRASVIGKSSYDLNIWAFEAERQYLVDGLKKGLLIEDFQCTLLDKYGARVPASLWAKIIKCKPVDLILMVGFDRTEEVNKLKHIENLNSELECLATTDTLTGLKNRRYLLEESNQALALKARSRNPVSLIICDIDNFKRINDAYGHDIGDLALKIFSDSLSDCARSADILARWGGEEFVMLLPDTNIEQACKLAERTRIKTMSLRIPISNGTIQYTASFGVAEVAEESTSLEETIKLADQALYKAKGAGRNNVQIALNKYDKE